MASESFHSTSSQKQLKGEHPRVPATTGMPWGRAPWRVTWQMTRGAVPRQDSGSSLNRAVRAVTPTAALLSVVSVTPPNTLSWDKSHRHRRHSRIADTVFRASLGTVTQVNTCSRDTVRKYHTDTTPNHKAANTTGEVRPQPQRLPQWFRGVDRFNFGSEEIFALCQFDLDFAIVTLKEFKKKTFHERSSQINKKDSRCLLYARDCHEWNF